MLAETLLLKKRKAHVGGLGNIQRETSCILKAQVLYFQEALLRQPVLPKKHGNALLIKKENSSEKEIAGPDLGEKRKIADIDRKEDHSLEGEKRKKLEVCSTTLTTEVA